MNILWIVRAHTMAICVDDCGVCGGDGFDCVNVVLRLGEVTDQSALEILYSSPVDIGGFQFDTDGVELTGVLSDFPMYHIAANWYCFRVFNYQAIAIASGWSSNNDIFL